MTFKAPSHIKGLAAKEWKRLLGYMQEHGYDKDEYVQTYSAYCSAVQTARECLDAITEHGHLVDSRQDTWARNPATMTLNQANQTILAVSKLFGFSPKDKREIEREKEQEGDSDQFTQYGV